MKGMGAKEKEGEKRGREGTEEEGRG